MKKLLIIEDDPVITRIYCTLFQTSGYSVETADDGEKALQALQQSDFDAVILDLGLPKVNGIEVLKQIRANDRTKKLPVIVFSNAYVGKLLEDAWRAGATKCIPKATCAPRQLVEIMDQVLKDQTPAPAAAAPAHRPMLPLGSTLDTQFEDQIRRSFLDQAPHAVASLREMLASITKASPDDRQNQLVAICRKVHTLTGNAAIVGFVTVAQLLSALESLLKELYLKPKNVNASTLRTVANAIDFLPTLIESVAGGPHVPLPSPLILVLDDDVISRRTVCSALELANLRSVSVKDPAAAFVLLEENRFDLIFSDVEMPGMDGFQFCAHLRTLPAHKDTPVVFVTSLSSFETRAKSVLSGGTDLIGKPFLLVELAVKALVQVSRRQLAKKNP